MKSLTKSISTPQLLRSSSAAPASRPDSGILNTIPDPRTPSPSLLSSRHEPPSTPPQHPDLSNEVALLSTKLINAINHQTTLDDSLQTTRHELEAAREKVAQLEAAAAEDAQMMTMMVTKNDYERMELQLRKELTEERRQRMAVDKEKKRIESELETLTTALFEEANTMVAAARKDREASEKRNEQLKTQLNDAELLLASHQEQLHDLKEVLQQMTSDQEETDTPGHATTAPPTPGLVPYDMAKGALEQVSSRPSTPNPEDTVPDHPLHFSHLISPVLRHDLPAFRDFQDLLKAAKASSAPASRVSSGNYAGLNVMGLGNLANLSSVSVHSQLGPSPQSSGIDSSLPITGSNSPRDPNPSLPPLKEMKFYKRALAEDIEPTLRLDTAPGISWLARRTVLNSMTAGSLTIEPHPPVSKFKGPVYPCSLCGENRVAPRGASKDTRHTPDPWARKHRFRTSEEKDAQRYPLCDYCLARVRSCCDYIGFLRLCRDGHWRAENGDEERCAWEESVRLRERMFWARLGGGVVPAYIQAQNQVAVQRSPALTIEKRRSASSNLGPGDGPPRFSIQSNLSLNVDHIQEQRLQGNTDETAEDRVADHDRDERQQKRTSAWRSAVTKPEAEVAESLEGKQDSAIALDSDEEKRVDEQAAEQLRNETRKSLPPPPREAEEEQRDEQVETNDLAEETRSVSMPGGFD